MLLDMKFIGFWNPSSSLLKIEIERKKLVPARVRQCTGEKQKRETDDFCYFSAHQLLVYVIV